MAAFGRADLVTEYPKVGHSPTVRRKSRSNFRRTSVAHVALAKPTDPVARLFYLVSHCWNHAAAGCGEPYFLDFASSSRSVAGGGVRESAPISARSSGVMTIFTESSEACS